MSDATITFRCECHWLSCQARVSLFEDDGTGALEIILPRRSFWERLRSALRHVFRTGTQPIAEVLLSKAQVAELSQFLVTNEYIDWKAEYTAQRDRELARLPESKL